MPSAFIADGFTIKATIKGRGFVPDLEVTYRPALGPRVYQWRRDTAAAKTAEQEIANDAKLVCERVNSWGDGEPVTPEMVAKLWPYQLGELIGLITGYAVPESPGQPSKQAEAEKNS